MNAEEKKQKIEELQKQTLADFKKLEKLARSIQQRPAKTPGEAINQAVKVVSLVIEAAMKHRQINFLATQKPDFHTGGKFSKNSEEKFIP